MGLLGRGKPLGERYSRQKKRGGGREDKKREDLLFFRAAWFN